MTPQRLQRKRTRGWRFPAGGVYVGRPTKWGNPFVLADCAAEAARDLQSGALPVPEAEKNDAWVPYAYGILLAKYRAHVEGDPVLLAAVQQELRGKTLLCWCKEGEPCHGDVLLEIANR